MHEITVPPMLQSSSNAQGAKSGDRIITYPITNVEPGDLKECGFNRAEITYLTEYLPDIARKMAEVYLDTRFWDDLRFFSESVLGQIQPLDLQTGLSAYLEELVLYTEEEAKLLAFAASESNPWLDQGANDAQGNGYVLPARYLSTIKGGSVISAEIKGVRLKGLFIDGPISQEVLRLLQDILGEARVWRAWPDSDFALVAQDSVYPHPMDDPLLAQLALTLPLEEVFHTLADVGRTFIDWHEGYLIAQNSAGAFETWPMLPDGRGIDENLSDVFPIVEYQGALYYYGNAYLTREEIYPAIQRELEK